jgi:hypothetical protein
MSLYSFTNLTLFVKKNYGIDPDAVVSSFQRITAKLSHQELNNRVRQTNSGFFYKDDNGVEHKGFLYIGRGYSKPYPDKETGELTIVPRFHTCNCETIASQIARNNYDGHYVFSAMAVEMDEHDGTKKDPKLCSRCHTMIPRLRSRMTTTQYEEILRNEAELAGNFRAADLPKHIDVLESGYTPDWVDKSREYRLKRRFTCENCGIRLNERFVDGYYLETHHLNGVKTDNRDMNLKCLCVVCHAFVDKEHQDNYKQGPNNEKLRSFLQLFREKLIEVKNPYLPKDWK